MREREGEGVDWDDQQLEALVSAAAGQHTLVSGAAGTGRSSLAVEVARRALEAPMSSADRSSDGVHQPGGGLWAPALVLAPDRRRASRLDRWLTDMIGSGATAKLIAPGSHRLVRSLDSYAYLVVGTWMVERTAPKPRPPVVSGAREDVWIAQFLREEATEWQQVYAPDVLKSPRFRMELRNILARSGQLGLLPSDLEHLAARTEVEIWRLAAQLYRKYAGENDVAFTVESSNFDSARLPRIAANVLRNWQQEAQDEGVLARPPIPGVLVVDDLQDFPASAVPLVLALVAQGTQVFATFNGKQTVTQFRGGTPATGVSLTERLRPNVVQLETNHRASTPVAELQAEVASWVPSSGLADAEVAEHAVPAAGSTSRVGRAPNELSTAGRDVASGTEKDVASGTGQDVASAGDRRESGGQVTAELVPSDSRMFALVEGYLRYEHLKNGVPWHDMAVICRSGADVETLRGALGRRGVPLHSSERSVVLAKVPICRALLSLLAEPEAEPEVEPGAELEAEPGAEPGAEARRQSESGTADQGAPPYLGDDVDRQLLSLLTSPLISADPLQVYRLLRQLRAVQADPLLGLKDLVKYVAATDQPHIGGKHVHRETWGKVRHAARVWARRTEASQMPAEVGLWHLWDGSEIAKTLRDRARSDVTVDALEAGDALDTVLALFRKADLWAQENVGRQVDAGTFVRELLSQQIETDTLAATGLTRRGVALLTAAEAAGQQWRVVVIPGLEQGAWPRATRDSFAQTERLADILGDARATGWEGEQTIMRFLPDPQTFAPRVGSQSAVEKRVDEARTFYSAVGRARETVRLVSTQNEDALPSIFINLLEEKNLTGPNYTESGDPIYADAPVNVDLQSLVGRLRRAALGLDVDAVTQRDAARALGLLNLEGVTLADPDRWAPGGTPSTDTPLYARGDMYLSPTQLAVADACPLRWFFETSAAENMELDEDPEQYDARQRGLIVHEIAEEHPAGTDTELQEALRQKWAQRGWETEEGWGKVHYQKTSEMLTRMAAYYRTVPSDVEVLLEQKVRFSLSGVNGGVNIAGRADRIEISEGGSARVIDIKTGRPPSVAEGEQSLQLLSYQLGVERMGYTPNGAALLSLRDGKSGTLRSQPALAPQDVKEAEQRILTIADGLVGPHYAADPETGDCDYCPFRLICPAQPESARGTE